MRHKSCHRLSAILASRFLLNFRELGSGVFTELSQSDEITKFSTITPRAQCVHLEAPIALGNLARPHIMIKKDVDVNTKEVCLIILVC